MTIGRYICSVWLFLFMMSCQSTEFEVSILPARYVALGQQVVLRAQFNVNMDYEDIDFEWAITQKPKDSAAQIQANQDQASFIADVMGEYSIVLKASGKNNYSQADVVVTSLSEQPAILTGLHKDDDFGAALATADFNGDGLDDLVVGIPGYQQATNANMGAMAYYESQAGVLTQQYVTYGQQAQSEMGAVIAAGDFDADGFDDFAVSELGYADPNQLNIKRGAVHVYYGNSDNSFFKRTQTIVNETPYQSSDSFGISLQVADFNNDGFDDLAVGAPGRDVGAVNSAGMVEIFPGSTQGLIESQKIGLSAQQPQALSKFGYSIAAGDITGNDLADLIVGAPYEDFVEHSNVGAVYVFKSVSEKWPSVANYMHVHMTDAQELAAYGWQISYVGDVNEDGFGDVAVTAPGYSVNGSVEDGALYLHLGTDAGINPLSFSQLIMSDEIGGMGNSFGPLDLDQDTVFDVLVGSPEDQLHGNVYVYLKGKLPATDSAYAVLESSASDGNFGKAIASGDIDGDGLVDLLIAADGQQSGLVYVYQ